MEGEEAMKNYVAKFHLTEEYQCFGTYWRTFAYVEVKDRVGELYPELDAAELRAKFLDEVP